MSRESDLRDLLTVASNAYRAGQYFFVARLKHSPWGSQAAGEMGAWGESLQAVESAGWVLDKWVVAIEAGGGPNAFPVFRRRDAGPAPLQDR